MFFSGQEQCKLTQTAVIHPKKRATTRTIRRDHNPYAEATLRTRKELEKREQKRCVKKSNRQRRKYGEKVKSYSEEGLRR